MSLRCDSPDRKYEEEEITTHLATYPFSTPAFDEDEVVSPRRLYSPESLQYGSLQEEEEKDTTTHLSPYSVPSPINIDVFHTLEEEDVFSSGGPPLESILYGSPQQEATTNVSVEISDQSVMNLSPIAITQPGNFEEAFAHLLDPLARQLGLSEGVGNPTSELALGPEDGNPTPFSLTEQTNPATATTTQDVVGENVYNQTLLLENTPDSSPTPFHEIYNNTKSDNTAFQGLIDDMLTNNQDCMAKQSKAQREATNSLTWEGPTVEETAVISEEDDMSGEVPSTDGVWTIPLASRIAFRMDIDYVGIVTEKFTETMSAFGANATVRLYSTLLFSHVKVKNNVCNRLRYRKPDDGKFVNRRTGQKRSMVGMDVLRSVQLGFIASSKLGQSFGFHAIIIRPDDESLMSGSWSAPMSSALIDVLELSRKIAILLVEKNQFGTEFPAMSRLNKFTDGFTARHHGKYQSTPASQIPQRTCQLFFMVVEAVLPNIEAHLSKYRNRPLTVHEKAVCADIRRGIFFITQIAGTKNVLPLPIGGKILKNIATADFGNMEVQLHDDFRSEVIQHDIPKMVRDAISVLIPNLPNSVSPPSAKVHVLYDVGIDFYFDRMGDNSDLMYMEQVGDNLMENLTNLLVLQGPVAVEIAEDESLLSGSLYQPSLDEESRASSEGSRSNSDRPVQQEEASPATGDFQEDKLRRRRLTKYPNFFSATSFDLHGGAPCMTHDVQGDGRDLRYPPRLPPPGLNSLQAYQSGFHKIYPHNMGASNNTLEDMASNIRVTCTRNLSSKPEKKKTKEALRRQIRMCEEIVKAVDGEVTNPPLLRIELFFCAHNSSFPMPPISDINVFQSCRPKQWSTKWAEYRKSLEICLSPCRAIARAINTNALPTLVNSSSRNAIATVMLFGHKLSREYCPQWKSGINPPKCLRSYQNQVAKIDPTWLRPATESEQEMFGLLQVLKEEVINDIMFAPIPTGRLRMEHLMRDISEYTEEMLQVSLPAGFAQYQSLVDSGKYRLTPLERGRNFRKMQCGMGRPEINLTTERNRSLIEASLQRLEHSIEVPEEDSEEPEATSSRREYRIKTLSRERFDTLMQDVIVHILGIYREDVRIHVYRQHHPEIKATFPKSSEIRSSSSKQFLTWKNKISRRGEPNRGSRVGHIRWRGDLRCVPFFRYEKNKTRKQVVTSAEHLSSMIFGTMELDDTRKKKAWNGWKNFGSKILFDSTFNYLSGLRDKLLTESILDEKLERCCSDYKTFLQYTGELLLKERSMEWFLYQEPIHNMSRLLFVDCRDLTAEEFSTPSRGAVEEGSARRRQQRRVNQVQQSSSPSPQITTERAAQSNPATVRIAEAGKGIEKWLTPEPQRNLAWNEPDETWSQKRLNLYDVDFHKYFYKQQNGACLFLNLLCAVIKAVLRMSDSSSAMERLKAWRNKPAADLFGYMIRGEHGSYQFGHLFTSLNVFKEFLKNWRKDALVLLDRDAENELDEDICRFTIHDTNDEELNALFADGVKSQEYDCLPIDGGGTRTNNIQLAYIQGLTPKMVDHLFTMRLRWLQCLRTGSTQGTLPYRHAHLQFYVSRDFLHRPSGGKYGKGRSLNSVPSRGNARATSLLRRSSTVTRESETQSWNTQAHSVTMTEHDNETETFGVEEERSELEYNSQETTLNTNVQSPSNSPQKKKKRHD